MIWTSVGSKENNRSNPWSILPLHWMSTQQPFFKHLHPSYFPSYAQIQTMLIFKALQWFFWHFTLLIFTLCLGWKNVKVHPCFVACPSDWIRVISCRCHWTRRLPSLAENTGWHSTLFHLCFPVINVRLLRESCECTLMYSVRVHAFVCQHQCTSGAKC